MGAIFGFLGSHADSLAQRMGDRLAHRGKQRSVTPLPCGGFVGALGDHPEASILRSDVMTLTTHAAIYSQPVTPSDAVQRFANAITTGSESLDAIDGDFAIAAVLADGTLALARDYFGCAPLYFANTPSGIAFASEYKALLEIDGFNPTPDRVMLQYLQHGKRLPLGRTLFTEIESVLPGSCLTIPRGGARRVHQAPPLSASGELSRVDEACVLIQDTLEEATRRRSCDLDTIGLALSGGIDSIALAFIFRELYPKKRLVTVCAGSSPEDHECVTARAVAEAVGAEHHEVITPPGEFDLGNLKELVWHLEDPYSRSEAYQLFEVGRCAAAAGCSVVFSAQGADGLFAGMPKYKLLRLMQRYPVLRNGLGEFWSYTQLGLAPRSMIGKLGVFAKFRGALPPVPRIRGRGSAPEPVGFPDPGPQFINRAMSRGFQAGVCQDIQKFERGFAAHGVAHRSPFYDPAFVQAAYSIDDGLKLKNGQEKWVFRRALEKWVPEAFVNIPKFPQRIEANRDLADALDGLITDVMAMDPDHALFEPSTVEGLIRKDMTKPYVYEAAMRLWTVILTMLWAEQFTGASGDSERCQEGILDG